MESIVTYKAEDYPPNKWVKLTLCLPRGEYSVAFIGTLGLAPKNSMAIDYISLLSTTCQPATTTKPGNIYFSLVLISNVALVQTSLRIVTCTLSSGNFCYPISNFLRIPFPSEN